jgi:3-phosphoshikimate 1-carboxyvinyltransferase
VLLAGLQAAGRTVVVERLGPTRDHTERLLNWFGVPIKFAATSDDATGIEICGPVRFAGRDITIPGDISSAAFLIAGAALLPGSELEIESVGLNPTRTQFLSSLGSLGFETRISEVHAECHEPVGNILVSGSSPAAPREHAKVPRVSGASIPQLIDELPLLAVVGTQISGGIEIRDAVELRLKETDRISATVTNLRAMGAEVEEFEDGLAVAGPASLRGSKIDSFGDHRIAMAFTIAALVANGESEISGAECVGISFPEFFGLLESIVER